MSQSIRQRRALREYLARQVEAQRVPAAPASSDKSWLRSLLEHLPQIPARGHSGN